MKSARSLSIAYNSYTKPKSHESSRYNLNLNLSYIYINFQISAVRTGVCAFMDATLLKDIDIYLKTKLRKIVHNVKPNDKKLKL